ncbi:MULTISPECIES: RNA polymerase sigma factor [Paenibacillus]|uniref:RNA polymerase sigma factor n=1 Tax=Paenibacillus TaxID=44249 RepID=UPI0022B8F01F|nr:sigma-70 family RNA polymerase sigma factor [Paenibacillus caseinilyticus]
MNELSFEYLQYTAEGLDKDQVLTELMETYGQEVWKYAYFLTLRADVADDLMQEVFLKVYRRLYTFRGESAVKTWLFSITRNAAKDYWKSHWVKRIVLFGYKPPEQEARSAEEEAIRAFEREEVWKDLFALPARHREVLLLHVHYEMPLQDIAGLLGISAGTVKSRLHRARERMNQKMKEGNAR